MLNIDADEHNAQANSARESHLACDHGHRHAVARELLGGRVHFADQHGIESRGDLVEQQDLQLHRHGVRDANALLLAAGELVGGELVSEADKITDKKFKAIFLIRYSTTPLLSKSKFITTAPEFPIWIFAILQLYQTCPTEDTTVFIATSPPAPYSPKHQLLSARN